MEHPGYGLSQCYTSVGFGFQGCTLPYITLNTVQSSVHEPEDSEQDVRNCGATVKTVATQSGERSQCKLIQRNTMPVPPLAQCRAQCRHRLIQVSQEARGGIEQLHSGSSSHTPDGSF